MNDDALKVIGRLQAERDALADYLLKVAESLAPKGTPEADRIINYLEKLLPDLRATSLMANELRNRCRPKGS